MADFTTLSAFFVVARAAHFLACLGIFGICVFDKLIAVPAIQKNPSIEEFWNRAANCILWIALPTALFSGIAWLIAVAIQMSGRDFSVDILKIVWSQTHFGKLWQLRSIFWLIACAGFFLPKRLKWILLIFSGLLAISLAWSGHGQTGRMPLLHLIADILHLFAASFWPIGLLPFALLLWKLRDAPQHHRCIAALTYHFSFMSLAVVALLTITGIANAFFLLGDPMNLFRTPYGRVLLLKIALFLLMIAMGAANLIILKPHLTDSSENDRRESTARQLQINVAAEFIFGVVILMIVGLLGILPPSPR